MSCTSFFENPSWAHEWLARHDKQREVIGQLRLLLTEAREVSQRVRLYFPGLRRRKSHDQNPIHTSIVGALDERAKQISTNNAENGVTLAFG